MTDTDAEKLVAAIHARLKDDFGPFRKWFWAAMGAAAGAAMTAGLTAAASAIATKMFH